jgi:hypothetical protein
MIHIIHIMYTYYIMIHIIHIMYTYDTYQHMIHIIHIIPYTPYIGLRLGPLAGGGHQAIQAVCVYVGSGACRYGDAPTPQVCICTYNNRHNYTAYTH